jgi:hypothetical protein
MRWLCSTHVMGAAAFAIRQDLFADSCCGIFTLTVSMFLSLQKLNTGGYLQKIAFTAPNGT